MAIYKVTHAGHGLIPGDLLFGGEYFQDHGHGQQYRFKAYDEVGGDKGFVHLPPRWLRQNVEISMEEPSREGPDEARFLAAFKAGYLGTDGLQDDTSVAELLGTISTFLLRGPDSVSRKSQKEIMEAFWSSKADFSEVHTIYRKYKDSFIPKLLFMVQCPSCSRMNRDSPMCWNCQSPLPDAVFGYEGEAQPLLTDPLERKMAKAFLPGDQRVRRDYVPLGRELAIKRELGQEPYLKSVHIEANKQASWLSALAQLVVFRKTMQGELLETFMHHGVDRGRGKSPMYHAFTQIFLDGQASHVWIHNTKDVGGEGATRVISFIDDSNSVFSPTHDQIIREFDTLKILDLSYEDLSTLLNAVKSQWGGSDQHLARFLVGLMVGGYMYPIPKTAIWGKVNVKKLCNTRDPPETPTVHVPIITVCMTLLSILFLTEAKQALPFWTANLDGLYGIVDGLLSFDLLIGRMLVLDKDARGISLRKEGEHVIGRLLPSANDAATSLSPAMKHTRKLKELVLPTFEVALKHMIALDFPEMMEQIKLGFQTEFGINVDDAPWFLRELDWETKELPEELKGFSNMPNKKRKHFVEPNKTMTGNDETLLIQFRMLTFIAPLAKTLLLRILLQRKQKMLSRIEQ